MQLGLPRFRVVKDKQTGLYKCHLCSYKSVYGSSLRSHFAVHSNARPYGCDMCSYEAKRLPDLKKHKILKHIRKGHNVSTSSRDQLKNKSPLQVFRDPSSGLYRCQHCSYQSDNARCVRSHLAVHSHLRPYACDMCSYEAKRSSDLSKHKIIKHGRVPCRRNKPRAPKPPKIEKPPPASTQEFNGISGPSSSLPVTSPVAKLLPDLDHSDVLSDLDYSLMTPTRAAFEALRRCNMEPLDMFNEYSSQHESFQQQNPVFPEPENDYNRPKYSQAAAAPDHEPPRYTSSTATCYSNQMDVPTKPAEETVFIKPEPPDDYFDHMNCQQLDSTGENYWTKLGRLNTSGPTTETAGQVINTPPTLATPSSSVTNDQQDPVEEAVGSSSDHRPTSSSQDATETVSTSSDGLLPETSDKSLVMLERRNVSGSSLMRPLLPTLTGRATECERASADCSQSRESGYSSPGSASVTPLSQPNTSTANSGFIELCETDNLTKGTNTRKSWSCPHCDVLFFDGALYFMHMGLHNSDEPWRCNMCATKFFDVYGFTSHFVNGHS